MLVLFLFLLNLLCVDWEHLLVENFQEIFWNCVDLHLVAWVVFVLIVFWQRNDLVFSQLEIPWIRLLNSFFIHFNLLVEDFFYLKLTPYKISIFNILSFRPPSSFFHDGSDEILIVSTSYKIEKLLFFWRKSEWLAYGHWCISRSLLSEIWGVLVIE